jgi:hypothetical protein
MHVPKLAFTVFDGKNPRIRKDKCESYFQIINTTDAMKLVIASMHMESNLARWLQVYKLNNGLGTWDYLLRLWRSSLEQMSTYLLYRNSWS